MPGDMMGGDVPLSSTLILSPKYNAFIRNKAQLEVLEGT